MLRIRSEIAVALLLAALAGCTQEPLQGPAEADFAKGGKPGKPQAEQVTLLEYWVEAGMDGGNLIHIVGEGDVDAVNVNVVHDYFFNGIRDDDYSPHYEYTHVGPPPATLQFLPDGTFHIDVSWDGERNGESDLFPDFLVTDVDGADPFTFDLYFAKNGEPVKGIQPQGIILDGENQGPEAEVPGDEGTAIRVTSYALYSGQPASGTVWIEELTLTEISCSLKKRRGESVTQITGTVHTLLGSDLVEPASAWLEFHLYDGEGITDRETYIAYGGVADFIISGVLPGSRENVSVQLQLDYLYPVQEAAGFVYDPGQNAVETLNWPAMITEIGDPVPVAVTGAEFVPCGAR
jgi:hypothetical protein